MKKKLVLCSALALLVAGASADLAVDLLNSTAFFGNVGTDTATDFNPASYLQSDSIVQLIWSETAPGGAAPGVGVGGGLLAGEVLLQQANVTDNAYGGWGPFGSVTYNDAFINASDQYDSALVNVGFFYARVFEGGGAAGEYYYTGAAIDASNWVLVGSDPSTVYTDSVMEAGVFNIDAQGTTVIPEPATIGLMGIAGLGMFLARRKSRR